MNREYRSCDYSHSCKALRSIRYHLAATDSDFYLVNEVTHWPIGRTYILTLDTSFNSIAEFSPVTVFSIRLMFEEYSCDTICV
jgi:hypothetical protein